MSTSAKPAPQMYPVEPDVLRYRLNKMMPYFSDVTYRLRPRPQEEATGFKTFAVDARFNWYYGETVPFTPDEQVAVLFHEINHLIRNHCGRQGDRDDRQWNQAGDREINDWFPPRMTPPSDGVGSSKYGMNDLGLPDDELAEWYFDRINIFDLHVREDAGPMSPGSGPCATLKGCDNKDVMPQTSKDGKFTVKQRGKFHVPVCGGAAGNGENDPDTGDNDGVSEIEAEAVRQNVAEKVMKEHASGRGTLPGSLVDWADAYLNPVVPWQKILKTSARRVATVIAGDTTQTFTKPPRRSPPGIILPKKISRKVTCAMYIDTSGSISNEEIQQGIAEVKGALRTNLADLSVSFVDTEVYTTIKAGNGAFNTRNLQVRRGGTDMRQCFTHAATLNPRPNLIIVMTDGLTPWPQDPVSDTRTIIVMTRDWVGHESSFPTPDWVWKVIQMEEKK